MTCFAAPASSCTALASSLRRQKPTPSASATTLASRSISALIETAATSPRARGVMAIDLYTLQEVEVRNRFPAVYQWVADRVKDRESDVLGKDVIVREEFGGCTMLT